MKVFDFVSVGFLLVIAVNMVIVFFLAFFNGGECLVTINTFGEQWVEVVLFPIWIIMGTVAFIRLIRQARKPRRVND